MFPNEKVYVVLVGIRCGNKPAFRKNLVLLYLGYKGLLLFFLRSKTNKRENKFNKHGNPGPESTTIMFGMKSNSCCGQNAFLSHGKQSFLKACQEINKALFVQLPTSMYSIKLTAAHSDMPSKVKPRRTHKLGVGGVPWNSVQ